MSRTRKKEPLKIKETNTKEKLKTKVCPTCKGKCHEIGISMQGIQYVTECSTCKGEGIVDV